MDAFFTVLDGYRTTTVNKPQFRRSTAVSKRHWPKHNTALSGGSEEGRSLGVASFLVIKDVSFSMTANEDS